MKPTPRGRVHPATGLEPLHEQVPVLYTPLLPPDALPLLALDTPLAGDLSTTGSHQPLYPLPAKTVSVLIPASVGNDTPGWRAR